MIYKALADACFHMATHGGYVLAFASRIAVANPSLTWAQFRSVLLANGHAYCGYPEIAVRRAFEGARGPCVSPS